MISFVKQLILIFTGSLDRDIVSDDGNHILYDLDQLEPIPCELDEYRRDFKVTVLSADARPGDGSCVTTNAHLAGGVGGGGGRTGGRTSSRTGVRTGGRSWNGGRGSRGSRQKRSAVRDEGRLWPSKTIAYQLNAPFRK